MGGPESNRTEDHIEHDPLGPHVSEGETIEDVEARQERLLREQLEVDLEQGK